MPPEQQRHDEIMLLLQCQGKDIELIKTKLIGNEEMRITGMSQVVDNHQKSLMEIMPTVAKNFVMSESHEKYINKDKKIKWMGAGILAFIAFLSSHAKEFYHWVVSS